MLKQNFTSASLLLNGGPMLKMTLSTFLFTLLIATSAFANSNQPTYEMRSVSTTLWDYDVDYFARPILLVRTADTHFIHNIEFNIYNYQPYCSYYENRCVAYDKLGRCVRWERVCVRWDYHAFQEGRRIEINFRYAAPLAKGETEVYELTI